MADIEVVTLGVVGPTGSGVADHEDASNSITHIRRVTSSTRPSGLGASDEGLVIYETDTDDYLYWTGTTWLRYSKAVKPATTRVYKSGTQSIAHNTNTIVTFSLESWDTDALHDTGVNTSRITVPTGWGGLWYFEATANWAANSSGDRTIQLIKNGGSAVQTDRVRAASAQTFHTLQGTFSLVAGDYMEMRVHQDSTVSLTLQDGADNGTYFMARYVGRV